MENFIENISNKFPCRENFFKNLYSLFGKNEQLCNAIYLYGQSGIGKSTLVKEFLECSKLIDNFVVINCIECYSPEILYEGILNKLNNYELLPENNYRSVIKCKNMMHFVNNLKRLDNEKRYVIVLDNAEELRDMDFNLLPCFLKLQEYTSLNICTTLISTIPFQKYHTKVASFEVNEIYVESYSKIQMSEILSCDFENVVKIMKSNIEKGNYMDKTKKCEILDSLDISFYDNYVNILLTVLFRVTRDVNELKNIARFCFEKYIGPVINEEIGKSDLTKLWKNITPTFLIVLRKVQIGMYQKTDDPTESNQLNSQLTQLELPFYTKYLLIAAFLASNNNPKHDKQMFMKNTGKSKKKSMNKVKAQVSEKMITQLGPQSFSIDRLLAIFYTILEEKVDLNAKLLGQISNLTHLGLLRYIIGESNVLESAVRLQCTVGLDFILHVGKSVGFNIQQYLCDFI